MLRRMIIATCAMLVCLCTGYEIAVADESAVYFYNPDGGKYIHTDPQCRTISSKYWPIMEQISLEWLKEEEYKHMMLCPTCWTEKNHADSFFKGKSEVEGYFDLTEMAQKNMEFYISCYDNALSYLIEDIGDREEQYQLLVEEGKGWWGYPDDDDVSREMAISLAYAALQEYIGIEDEDLYFYFADPWLDVQTYDYHEWTVRLNRVIKTYKYYNSHGYYVYINAENGLISKIRYY